jgi:hypothetical protein
MMERIAEASPRFKARIAGVFYLLTILTGGFAVFVRGRFVVYGGAAATATNILAHEPLFRLGSQPSSSWSRAISLRRLSSITCLSL